MKNTEKENTILFYLAFIMLSIFKFSFMGFSYIPYLDDYVQYTYYPLLEHPFSDVLFGGAGFGFTRPFAAILDIYFWSSLFKFPYLAQILLSLLFSLSGIIFYIILKKLKMPTSPLFLIIYTLLPSLTEGTYWISAATRIVPALFLTALALYFMVSGKNTLFFIFSLFSHGFYEQVTVLYFTAAFLIFLAAPKRFYKAFLLSIFSILIIASYYLLFGKISDNSQRLNFDTKFFFHIKSNLSKIFELLFEKQLPLYTKGFLRSIEIIKTTNSYMWSSALILILVFIFIFFPKEKYFCPIKKKLISGIILFIAPTLLFMILDEPWLNFRNVVPSVLGFAIIIDALFTRLLKHRIKYLAIILSFYLLICNVSEIFDYHKTAEHDSKIIYEVTDLYNGEKEIYYEIKTEKYLEQNSPYHDHIMSIVGSDWGLTGTVRAVLKNKDIVVKSNL